MLLKWASQVVLVVTNPPAKAEEETWIQHLGREDPLEEGGSQGQRSMAGYSPWVHKESHETKAT